MRNRTTQSALLVAGAAAVGVGVGVATWLGKRRLASVPTGPQPSRLQPEATTSVEGLVASDRPPASHARGAEFGVDEASSRTMLRQEGMPWADLVEPVEAELPLGRSADRQIDQALSRRRLPQDETSGAVFLGEAEPFAADAPSDASLDEVWNSLPGVAEGEQSEGYDAVSPEDLGSVWLERATQTTREDRPHGSDPTELPELESLLMSEATLSNSHQLDEDDEEEDDEEEDEDEDEIAEDELDER